MKLAITQLHSLSSIDKKNNVGSEHEMRNLIDENEKLKAQLQCAKSKLKEKERELLMIKREKTRLHEISNRYHHELTRKEVQIDMDFETGIEQQCERKEVQIDMDFETGIE